MGKRIIAIEIGGTKQQLAIGKNGKIEQRFQVKLEEKTNAKSILEWIDKTVSLLIGRYDIEAIGIGFGGPIHPQTGKIVCSCQVEGWENFPLYDYFRKKYACPVFVRNDSVCGGLGEWLNGAGSGAKRLFYTNIGTGIGGGLFEENCCRASSFGYLWVPDWTSENRHEATRLEFLCSGMMSEKRLQRSGYIPSSSSLKTIERVTMKDVANAAANGDSFANEELDRIARSFSLGLCDILATAYPDKIVIGGGVMKIGDLLLKRIRQETQKYEFIENHNSYTIEKGILEDDAVLIGAMLLAERKNIQKISCC